MRGQLLGGLADIAEQRGDRAGAEQRHTEAVALIAAYYPGSAALLNTQARLAAFYARTGQAEPALALYRQIVDANAESGNSSATLGRWWRPISRRPPTVRPRPERADAMSRRSQGMLGPGGTGGDPAGTQVPMAHLYS